MRFTPATWPSWITGLGVPAWIVGESGALSWLNPAAEELLLGPNESGLGRPCHEIVECFDSLGRGFCQGDCEWQRRARRGETLTPYVLRVGGEESRAPWCHVLPILFVHEEQVCLLHCALHLGRDEPISDYLTRVASRTPHRDVRTAAQLQRILSAREMDVLELLAQDRTLHDIAGKLCLSYITVRNHVQHLLHKLDTHTIQQAVAIYLLTRDDAE